MKIIVSIPAYNEEKTLGLVLEEIKHYGKLLTAQGDQFEILVLDDGSRDQTVAVAKEHGVFVVSNKRNRGLAETFRREMAECLKRGVDIIVHTDADGQYHPKHIPELVQNIKAGYDLVLGSRFRGKIEHMPLLKRLGNNAFSKVISSLTKVRITDTTTGYRAFTAEVAREINYINTFTYTQEQIIKATQQG